MEGIGLLEDDRVAGIRIGDKLLGRCRQSVEPLERQLAAAPKLVLTVQDVDGEVEGGDIGPEVEVLQLRVHEAERVSNPRSAFTLSTKPYSLARTPYGPMPDASPRAM